MKSRFIKKQEENTSRVQQIFKVKNACPLCKGDVKGSPTTKFYCKTCNLLFRTQDLEGNV